MPNRLANETSPYLRQHKDNPVDWYPWGPAAFEEAKRRDVPVLVSIGYSSCHWCHVMAHESFEDPDMAKAMNDRFVNIKVDREERPDVDAIYMQATQAMGNQGGWPLNVFVTPDGLPFFGGTYWPKYDHPPMPGFQRVLTTIAAKWREDRENLLLGGQKVADYLRQSAEATPPRSPVTPELLTQAVDALKQQFDPEWGGFGNAPKFPQPSTLRFLLRHYYRTKDLRALRMAEMTLDMMAAGGIHDQLGGGFSRYSVDERWHVPHFEKMLYDNAQLLDLYTELWTITKDDLYRDVASGIVAWLNREMLTEGGGFAAALDADSEGVEGKYYIWSAAEVDQLLSADAADLVKLHFGITDPGTFEGKTVLSVVRSVEEIAEQTGQDIDAITSTLSEAKARMLEVRQQRVAPGRDDKVIAGWNGLMIHALAHAGIVFQQPDWVSMAGKAADFILQHLQNEDRSIARSWNSGQTRGDGVLEDYACMAYGLVELYAATGNRNWLNHGSDLLDYVRKHFRHDSGIGFYDTSDTAENLITRPRDLTDTAVPSGNGVMAEMIFVFGIMEQKVEMIEASAGLIESLVRPMGDYPLFMGQFLSVAQRIVESPRELVFAGTPASERIATLRYAAGSQHEPLLVVGYNDPGDPGAGKRFPMLTDRPVVDDGAAYLCQDFTCLPPATTGDKLVEILNS
ncbi:MAG TPA: thioredoxin domain-containing protein [Thermomicrobiales bacterium]|nr:thioredoxin domain-containing protein [Thermomicrobiales bacterium]